LFWHRCPPPGFASVESANSPADDADFIRKLLLEKKNTPLSQLQHNLQYKAKRFFFTKRVGVVLLRLETLRTTAPSIPDAASGSSPNPNQERSTW
jgi:hypothetical protein